MPVFCVSRYGGAVFAEDAPLFTSTQYFAATVPTTFKGDIDIDIESYHNMDIWYI